LLCALSAGWVAAWAADKQPTAPVVDLDAMVLIDDGTFRMGTEEQTASDYGDAWFINQLPDHDVTLEGYAIDTMEVSVEQFALFLTHAAGEYHYHPDQPIERVTDGYLPIPGREDEPIRFVTWEAAHHYCLWAGKALPTEAQWERAAAGEEGRTYPWGDDGASCTRASYFTGTSYCNDGPQPVGSHPDGDTPDGVADMGGNVAEWVADYYGEYGSDSLSNPTGPGEGTLRVVRGGGFNEGAKWVRTRARRGVDPEVRSAGIGLRCVFETEGTDGALRGTLTPPADEGRQATDRPLADPLAVPEILARGMTSPTSVVRLDGAWYVLDVSEGVIFEIGESDGVPAVFAEGLESPADLATDGADLYVTDTGAEALYRVGAGGSLEILATGAGLGLLVADGGEVFYVDEDGIHRHDGDGITPLAALTSVTDLTLAGDDLYFSSADGTEGDEQVGRVHRSGGAVETLAVGSDMTNSYDPMGVVHDEAEATTYFLMRKDGWPSNVELCEFPDGAGSFSCFAHAPPKAGYPLLHDGQLLMASQYNVIRMDPADETYRVVGPLSESRGFAVADGWMVWTDVDDGRLYQLEW